MTDLLRDRWDVLLVISAGGALGSLGRWGVGQLQPWTGSGFPWGTFVANLTGAFALGILLVFVHEVWPPGRYLRPFVGVGLLGGYTTFSTYMLETQDLLLDGRVSVAMIYLFGTLAAGLLAAWVGGVTARLVVHLARRRRQARRVPETEAATPEARSPR